MLTGVTSTSSNTQIIHNCNPQSGGTVGTLIFWLQVRGMTLYLQRIRRAGASLQMTGGHNLFRLYSLVICDHCPPPQPRGMSRTLILSLQFPIVTITLWRQLAGKPWQFSPAVCYYTALPWLPMSIKHLHLLRIMETM